MALSEHARETLALRAQIIDLWLENRALALQDHPREYDPNQPRAAAGTLGAGRWVEWVGHNSGGSGGRIQVAGGYAGMEGMLVLKFVSLYCEARILRKLPSEFLPMTIADVEALADAGNAKARTCLKLLKRDDYRK